MRRLIALFLVGGCLFTAVLFAMGAARAEKCADAVWQNPVLYLEKPISAEDAQNIAESAVFTAWGETADQTVTDPDLGKVCRQTWCGCMVPPNGYCRHLRCCRKMTGKDV